MSFQQSRVLLLRPLEQAAERGEELMSGLGPSGLSSLGVMC